MEEPEVKASEQEQESVTAEEQQIAEKINDAAKTPVEAQGQPEEETPSETLSHDKIAEMTAKAAGDAAEKALNSFQGKFANHSASQQKELQDMIDEKLKPVLDWTEKVEQAQVEQLEPEQQVEYYKSKLSQQNEVAEEPKVQTAKEPTEAQKLLADTTRQLIKDNSLTINEFDERIWNGWNADMSTGQLVSLAQKNIQNMAKPKAETPTSQQTSDNAPPAPPSTSGAPKGPGSRVSTISDLSELMANGQIDATQYRAAKRKIQQEGFANL